MPKERKLFKASTTPADSVEVFPPIDLEEQDEILGTYDAESIRAKLSLLNKKQRLVFISMLNGMNNTQACREAGYKSAGATRTIKKRIPDLMQRCGLSDKILLEKLKEKLDAKETKFFQMNGQVTETREVVAHGIQMQALDMSFKLRGAYIKPEEDRSNQEINVQIVNVGGA